MSRCPSKKPRPIDEKSLALLLETELACSFILQRSTPSPPRSSRGRAPSHKELDEILQRIAVALTKLSTTCDAACDLLSPEERDAVKALARRGPQAAGHDAARRLLLAAVPRLFFETQALICEGREPWHLGSAQGRGLRGSGSLPVAGFRAGHT